MSLHWSVLWHLNGLFFANVLLAKTPFLCINNKCKLVCSTTGSNILLYTQVENMGTNRDWRKARRKSLSALDILLFVCFFILHTLSDDITSFTSVTSTVSQGIPNQTALYNPQASKRLPTQVADVTSITDVCRMENK